MDLWEPTTGQSEASEEERLELALALAGVRAGAQMAEEVAERAAGRRAVWAMRGLQALQGIEEEARQARVLLAGAAADEGQSLRQIAEAAGVSHATVRKWVNPPAATPSQVIQSSPRAEFEPLWLLGPRAIAQVAARLGLSAEAEQAALRARGWK